MRLYSIKPILIGSSSSQIISKFATALIVFISIIAVFGFTPTVMADQNPQNPNLVRGPIVTSIPILRERYCDGSFPGGARFQAEVNRVVPRNGTPIPSSCKSEFKVGMEVVALISKPNGMLDVSVGDRGLVLSSAVSGEILVQWFGKHSGHDGMGNGTSPEIANDGNSRWFVRCNEVRALGANDSAGNDVQLQFIGLQQSESVIAFYDAGFGSSGSGPGPNYGTNFSAESRTYYTYNGSNEPNPGTVATVSTTEMTLNFDYSIQAISFVYSSTVNVQVQAYSGLNGTGNVVGSWSFSPNTSGPSGNTYNTWSPSSSAWTVGARSIRFTGSANYWGLDNITFVNCPDADGDGTSDCTDGCPNDPAKTAPGICGCGVADTDTDGDGTADCNDGCPADANKTAPGICGCGVADTDTDGDGTADCNDGCPADANKTAPGICGCGVADTDTDGDGVADCNDGCPADANKTAPGICGCGVADTDTDGDGTADCNDGCPADPAKTAPGICGCGVADTDTDGDSTADCNDGCPADANKTAPGICGCAVADTDTDGDGTADCNDNCVLIANPGQEDCNGNSIGDTCDIASGQALDCNGNSIPDSCDISSGTSADGDSDGIPDECEPTPAIQLVVVGSPSCVTAPGSEVSYEIQVINPPFGLVAGQFFVEWDTTTFALIGVSAGDAPFNSIPYSSDNVELGRVFLIASVDGGGTGTSESRTVARLQFQALTVNCSPTVPQVRFMAALPQILTDGQGGSETLPLTNPIAVRIDGIAPVITGTPASITVDADAGPGCASVQVVVPPTASDNCEVATFTFSRSDGEVITAPFPCGTTTMTWVATDSCGLSSSTSSTVTVNPFQTAFVEVQTNGATGNFQRCITFTLSGDGATHTTSEVLTFNSGIGSTQLRVPVGNYGCVTADDRLHTLSQQAELEVSGTQYVADFTGSQALFPGDLNNDNVVDVVDWGVLVVRIGQTASVNTNCETPAFQADVNADGFVNAVDGNLLLNVILLGGETCSSGAADGGANALQSISVKKLTEMGIANAESCDIDNNGIVDLFDMLLWQQNNSQN